MSKAKAWFNEHEGKSANYTAKFEPFERDDKKFVKVFAIDEDTFNRNRWGVTREAMLKALDTLIGKPLLGPPSAGHGPITDDDAVLSKFEAEHTIGRFVDVGSNGVAYGIAEITKPEACWEDIKSGKWKWVSPQIQVDKADIERTQAGDMVHGFRFRHITFVAEPAYGGQAGLKGTCEAGKLQECTFAAALDKVIGQEMLDVTRCMEVMMDEGYNNEDARKVCTMMGRVYKGRGGRCSELKELLGVAQPQRPNLTGQECDIEALKQANVELDAQVKALLTKERARLDAEVADLSGKLVDLKIKAGLVKAEDKTAAVDAVKTLPIPALNSLIADFEALVAKVAEAQTPKRDVSVSYQRAAVDPSKPNSLQILSHHLIGGS